MLNNQRVYYIYTVSENKITKLRFTSVISLVFHLTPLKSPLTVDGTTIHCWSWINIILQKKPRKSIKISNIIHQYPTYLPNKFTASRLTRPTAILPILPGFMYLSQYLAARSGSGPKHLGKTSTCSEAGNSPVSRLLGRRITQVCALSVES